MIAVHLFLLILFGVMLLFSTLSTFATPFFMAIGYRSSQSRRPQRKMLWALFGIGFEAVSLGSGSVSTAMMLNSYGQPVLLSIVSPVFSALFVAGIGLITVGTVTLLSWAYLHSRGERGGNLFG